MSVALIALGANLGERETTLQCAVQRLAEFAKGLPQISAFYRSQPIGGPAGQGEFLNAAVRLETTLSPEELLARLQLIESDLGRTRHERWDARTIDLDLLLYDEELIETPQLTVPHPRLAFRRFMCEPAAEIAPAMRHPTLETSLAELAAHLREAYPLVAIHAAEPQQSQNFANELAVEMYLPVLLKSDGDFSVTAAAGRNEAAAIEFLKHRAGELAAIYDHDIDLPVIVPYWLEALRRQAADRVGGDAEFGQAIIAGAIQPKLLIWLESHAAPFHQPPRLPAVRVSAENISKAREEAAAAILAMQTPVYR